MEPKKTGEEPIPAPMAIVGIVAGVVVIALAIFFFIRIKVKRAKQ